MRKKILTRLSLWLPVVFWALLIFRLSSNTLPNVTGTYWGDFMFKKFSHVLFYGFFTALLYRALIGEGMDKYRSAVLSVLLAVSYGLTDEYHQSLIPGREPRLRDVFFDGIGSSLVSYFLYKILPKMPKEATIAAKKLGFI